MPEILHRVELREPQQARAALTASLLPWIGEQLNQGHELVLEARLLDDDITDKQRGYLHAGVLTQIAQEASVNGERFAMPVWKEFYRDRFLGFRVVTCINPLTGRKSRRRQRNSTEDLGVRGMALYIDKVIAHASTDLGLTIRPPLTKEVREAMKRYARREWVDQDTGEIHTEEATA